MGVFSRTAMLMAVMMLGALAAAPLAAQAAPAPAPVCRAAPLKPGQQIEGVVLHVPDAQMVCIARGPTPADWIPVRLAQPARDRASLMALTFAKRLTCRAGPDGRSACQVGGVTLASAATAAAQQPIKVAWR